jgi:hypothetical protein
MAFYCIKQRRRGAREARIAEAKYNDEQRELAAFKAAGINPDSLQSTGTEYNAKEMAREGITSKDSYSVPNTPGSPENEKWGTAAAVGAGAGMGAAAAAGARNNASVPLLREGSQSPRITSPPPQTSPYNRDMYNSSPAAHANAFSPPNSARSPGPLINPMQSPQHQQPHRSFTAPGAQMRVGSPGPQQSFGAPLPRNPNPMMAPQPQRSFTTGGYAAPGYGQNDGPDQYWGNNNYR